MGSLVLILLYRSGGNIRTHLGAWYSDSRLVAWAGVGASLAVVGIALFRSDGLPRAHLVIPIGWEHSNPPWCLVFRQSVGSMGWRRCKPRGCRDRTFQI